MRENVLISEDKELLNLSLIHDFLSNESAWAKGISLQTVKTSVENSLCIGAYINNVQVGFCRVITDYATFANLVDVIVWPKYRGQAISKLIMKSVIEHHKLVGIRRFTLATTDAHGLYKQFGFNALNKPETFMERYDGNVYTRS
jgi:N-acetylglutamate synthase-like GNAT family acetyltransferase